MAQVCPVVGTTNTVLPPSHPAIDSHDKEAVCPVTNASLKNHQNLDAHPPVEIPASTSPSDASKCPALKTIVKEDPIAQKTDEEVCPVVGTATTILPPDHPSVQGADKDTECPVTKAKVGHHTGKVFEHPAVDAAASAAQCPVVGARA